MNKKEMERNLKNYCREQFNDCKNHGADISKALDRSYGAMMFCINNCFSEYNDELVKWWDDKMLPKFRELERER